MRIKWRLVAIVMFFCGCTHAQSSSRAADRTHDLPELESQSVSDWECLRTMVEPSLLEAGDQHSYRFVHIQSMQNEPRVVRLSIQPDGTGEVTTKVLRYKGDCKLGKLTKNKKRVVSKKAVDSLLKRIEEADFWQLPTDPTELGLDGSSWVVEGVKDRNYHFVDRWSPRKGKYKKLCEEFMKLGSLRVPYD